jgi:hypothetical protein
MECDEPPKPNDVKVSESTHQDLASLTPVQWSEEERGNVVTFFTLLDQWDRKLGEKKGAA